MAFLLDDDKDRLENGAQSEPAGEAPASSGTAAGGAVAGQGTGGVSTAGVGAGGSGAWTNIQSYLNANKGNTSTAKYFDDTVNKTLDDESNRLTTEASSAQQKAQAEFDKTNISKDQASQLVAQAGNSDPTAAEKLKTGISAQYAGPDSFAFGLGAKAQNYGSGIQEGQFPGFMDSLYKEAAGGKLSNGQLNLQHQLDVDGDSADALEKARQSALMKYAGLQSNLSTLVPQTDSKIKEYQSGFQNNQNALKENLNGIASQDRSELSRLADQHNAFNSQLAQEVERYKAITGQDPGYTPGTTADETNIDYANADEYRNQWNALAGILGLGNPIAKAQAAAVRGSAPGLLRTTNTTRTAGGISGVIRG